MNTQTRRTNPASTRPAENTPALALFDLDPPAKTIAPRSALFADDQSDGVTPSLLALLEG